MDQQTVLTRQTDNGQQTVREVAVPVRFAGCDIKNISHFQKNSFTSFCDKFEIVGFNVFNKNSTN